MCQTAYFFLSFVYFSDFLNCWENFQVLLSSLFLESCIKTTCFLRGRMSLRVRTSFHNHLVCRWKIQALDFFFPPNDLGKRLDLKFYPDDPWYNNLHYCVRFSRNSILQLPVFKEETHTTYDIPFVGHLPWCCNVFILFHSLATSYSFFKGWFKVFFFFSCEVFPS